MHRAVSDTLAFVLIFGIIVSTVGVVYVGGFEALTEARDDQRFTNTERALEVLDANIEDLSVRGARSRTTELQLSNGELEFGNSVSWNVTVDNDTYYRTTVRPLVYRSEDGSELVYSNGALFRQYGDTAVMFDEPRIAVGDRLLVPYVITRAASRNVSTDRSRRILIRTDVTDRAVRRFQGVNATLNVTSPRAAAWERYLQTELGTNCTGPEEGQTGKVSCDLPSDEVYIQAVVVDVAFT
jgi:hypothetical protein